VVKAGGNDMEQNWVYMGRRNDNPKPEYFKLKLPEYGVGVFAPSRVKFIWRQNEWHLRSPWLHRFNQQELEALLDICKKLNEKNRKKVD
jgi:hypothetical protein